MLGENPDNLLTDSGNAAGSCAKYHAMMTQLLFRSVFNPGHDCMHRILHRAAVMKADVPWQIIRFGCDAQAGNRARMGSRCE